MKLRLLSSLTKVFCDKEPNFPEFTEFSALKNEAFSFQLALFPEEDSETVVSLSLESRLKSRTSVYYVKAMPSRLSHSENHDCFYYEKRSEYPDLFLPIKNEAVLKKNEWNALWYEYSPKKNLCGKRRTKITVTCADGTAYEKVFVLNIIDALLPPQKLLYTNWFHNDCLCTYYSVEPFSKEYWQIAENYIENAVNHGMNMILTPIFTPPLDTEVGKERPTFQLVDVKRDGEHWYFSYRKFERYIKMCLKCGIEAFEISHLFTQWGAKAAPKIVAEENGELKRVFGWETDAAGAEYRSFLEQFAASFTGETEKLGIKERCFMHVSDEPGIGDLESYKKGALLLHSLFKGFRFIDALSDLEFFKSGLVYTPIPCENEADVFLPEVENFWTYYCCGQVTDFLPNRLFSMPSQRNRVLGFLLYKYNAEGFLQWGHNFWYSQYSKRALNPFEETDAGEAFPSGDSFVVYPGESGAPLNSLRHEVFYEGICDLRALRLLESLTSREHVLKLLSLGLDTELTFRDYPHTQEWLLETRARINREIENHIS